MVAKRLLVGGPPGLSLGVRIPELFVVERLRKPLVEDVGVVPGCWGRRDPL